MFSPGPMPASMIPMLIWSIFSSALFLYLGALLAGVKRATVGRAFLAGLLLGVLRALLPHLFVMLPFQLSGLDVVITLLCTLFVVQMAFSTNVARAAVVLLFHFVAQWVVELIIGFYLEGGRLEFPWEVV